MADLNDISNRDLYLKETTDIGTNIYYIAKNTTPHLTVVSAFGQSENIEIFDCIGPAGASNDSDCLAMAMSRQFLEALPEVGEETAKRVHPKIFKFIKEYEFYRGMLSI